MLVGPSAVVVVGYQPSGPAEPVIVLDFAAGPVCGLAAQCSVSVAMGGLRFACLQFSEVDVGSVAAWYPSRQHLQRLYFAAFVQGLDSLAVIVVASSCVVAAS